MFAGTMWTLSLIAAVAAPFTLGIMVDMLLGRSARGSIFDAFAAMWIRIKDLTIPAIHQLLARNALQCIHRYLWVTRRRRLHAIAIGVGGSVLITVFALLLGDALTRVFGGDSPLNALQTSLADFRSGLTTSTGLVFLLCLVVSNLICDALSIAVTLRCLHHLARTENGFALLIPVIDVSAAFILACICRGLAASMFYLQWHLSLHDLQVMGKDILELLWLFAHPSDVRELAVAAGVDLIAPVFSSTTLLPTALVAAAWLLLVACRTIVLPLQALALRYLHRVSGEPGKPSEQGPASQPFTILGAGISIVLLLLISAVVIASQII